MTTKAEQALDFWSPLRPPEGVRLPGQVVFFGYYGHCSVIVCDEVHDYGPVRHASIAHPYRYPTWEEIVAVRDRWFGPDTECVMVIPRRTDYVKAYPHAFHVWGDPEGRRIWVLTERGTDDERRHGESGDSGN